MLDCVAWAPRSTNPLLRQAITKAPINAPITVPEPPVSAVPPITAAAMASKVRLLPPASGAAEPEMRGRNHPGQRGQSAQDHEGGDLDAIGADADLARGQQVAACRDHMETKDRSRKNDGQDHRDVPASRRSE